MKSVGRDGRCDETARTFFSYADREGRNVNNDEGGRREMESGNESCPNETTDATRVAYASVIMVMSPIDISPTASASASTAAAS